MQFLSKTLFNVLLTMTVYGGLENYGKGYREDKIFPPIFSISCCHVVPTYSIRKSS